ncbi:hypothetical protein BD847_1475 [Flavobacterium cutihirudinis]|uniref:Lipoprotein n=1 Tax=Flavobacterium cutihirudinis TaxID=1265740 RepID=A0A3D9FVF6_9FLAO|nr:hypothetical protein [Flavobacterium cutihirudinis]RED24740.1 hypothetical protein BD847_1475 [Flavobacterium cutihirudinis]
MRNLLSFLAVVLLCSCESNSQNSQRENFKKEVSEKTLEKIINNSPFPLSSGVMSSYKYFNYYELFRNSGVCVQFNLNKETEKEVIYKLKKYEHLKNNLVARKDSSYVYNYSDNNGKNIQIPELSEEFGERSSINLTDNKQVDIYLIEEGNLENIYIDQNKQIYNYSIGLYYFKKSSNLIYWFLIY